MEVCFSYPSFHNERLFLEFLTRYKDLKNKQKQETIYFLLIICLGVVSLLLPWISPAPGLYIAFFLWGLFYLLFKQYIKLKTEVEYLFVNVNVLYHHFLGKLEVGFCNHQNSCDCAANFKSYVSKKFGISLGKDIFN